MFAYMFIRTCMCIHLSRTSILCVKLLGILHASCAIILMMHNLLILHCGLSWHKKSVYVMAFCVSIENYFHLNIKLVLCVQIIIYSTYYLQTKKINKKVIQRVIITESNVFYANKQNAEFLFPCAFYIAILILSTDVD